MGNGDAATDWLTLSAQTRERAGCDRDLFYRLVNFEGEPAVVVAAWRRVRSALRQVADTPRLTRVPPDDESALRHTLSSAGAGLPRFCSDSRTQWIVPVRQYAPTALLSGCWLQKVSQAATCHTEAAAHLFTLYSDCIGSGSGVRHAGNRYRAWLERLGIDLPPVTARAFSDHPDLLDSAFHTPVVLLGMSLFPRRFLPELIGITLAWSGGLSSGLRCVSSESCARFAGPDAESVWLDCGRLGRWWGHAWAALQAYRRECALGARSSDWLRVRRGMMWYCQSEAEWLVQVRQSLLFMATPRERMVALVRQKASYARGHHRCATIGGRLLDDWFAAEPFDAEGFVDALAHSPVVTPGDPQASRLLTDLAAFGGPMFRIFSPQERTVIDAWVRSLPDRRSLAASRRSGTVATGDARCQAAAWLPNRPLRTSRGGPFDQRQLFFRLVNSDRFPGVVPVVQRLVSRRIATVSRCLDRQRSPLRRVFEYTPAAFDARIDALYRNAIDAYRPPHSVPRLSREVYVWGVEQLAPVVLVDGCWLQNIAQAGRSGSPLSTPLFRIYADEVGNGQPRLNHPNVYRRLLQSLAIDLPPLHHRGFAAHPGFIDAAFDLPVFLLAISQCPQTFLAEILGLNLAIELSGLGASYLRLVDELDYWGIDSTIVRLHISIDNMAGGHAALACDAIRLYLDQVRADGGEAGVQRHWRRVWTGFLSLEAVSKRFALAMLWRYGVRFAFPRWRRRIAPALLTLRSRLK